MLKACKGADIDSVVKMTSNLGVKLTSEERELEGKALMRCVMKRWLPAADAMLDLIDEHLPSPDVAQKYRTDMLYEGPLDDPAALGK